MADRSAVRPVDRVLPGLSRAFAGRASGALVLLAWVSLLAVSVWRRQRIAGIIADPGPDGILRG